MQDWENIYMIKNKKSIIYSLSLLSVVLISGCTNVKEIETKTYKEYVSDFKSLSFDSVINRIEDNQNYLLYIGRESCSYCQIFVPKLHRASELENVEIYYWDVENIDKNNLEIDEFLNYYQVEYTPTLLKLNGYISFESIDFDSENVSIDELRDIVKKE